MVRQITDEKVRRVRLERLRAALAKGERDITTGRATTLEGDADIKAFLAAL